MKVTLVFFRAQLDGTQTKAYFKPDNQTLNPLFQAIELRSKKFGTAFVLGKGNLKTIAMKELMNRYTALKHQALELMKAGKVSAYLAKLQEVNDLRFQMIQISTQH